MRKFTVISIIIQSFLVISWKYPLNRPVSTSLTFDTLTAMGKRFKRFRRRVAFSLLMLSVATAFYVGPHFYGGGTVAELTEAVRAHYATVAEGVSKTASLAEEAKHRIQGSVSTRRDGAEEEAGAISIFSRRVSR